MGLRASKATEENLLPEQIINFVAETMALDPSGRSGQNNVKKQIALRTGIHLKRQVSFSISKATETTLLGGLSQLCKRPSIQQQQQLDIQQLTESNALLFCQMVPMMSGVAMATTSLLNMDLRFGAFETSSVANGWDCGLSRIIGLGW